MCGTSLVLPGGLVLSVTKWTSNVQLVAVLSLHVVSSPVALTFIRKIESAGMILPHFYIVLELAYYFYSSALVACLTIDISRSADEHCHQL